MTRTTCQTTIIGTITHSDTNTEGGLTQTHITIPHTYWNRQQRVTTEYRFKFFNVPPNHMAAYQEGMVVKVDFELVNDEYDYQLKPKRLTPLGQTVEGAGSVAINRVTGIIGNVRHKEWKGATNAQIGIPVERRNNDDIETTWLNFTYWRVPEHLNFLYEKFNVVSVDFHIINKEDKYTLRPEERITLHKGQPKEQAKTTKAPAKKTQTRKKATA